MSEGNSKFEDRNTGEYPRGGPTQLRYEAVTGKYEIGELEELLKFDERGVPENKMNYGDTDVEELTSGDITVLSAKEVAALISTASGQAIPVDEIHELTTQQLADAIVSGPISEVFPTRMITDVTTEILTPEQVDAAEISVELKSRVRTIFDGKVEEYMQGLDEVMRRILENVRDKVCAKFEGVYVDNPDSVIEAIGVQMNIIIEAIITREFGKLINQGYIRAN